MTLKEKIMKLQTYKMHEGEDTVYVERDDALKALEQEPCEDATLKDIFCMGCEYKEQEPSREFEDYENEIEDLHNRLDIAEYDKERLREEVTNLEAKIKALKQEPCEMTAEKYRQKMIQTFHNADCDGLIALVILPTEKEFEHLGWLLEKHYKAKPEPCTDAISREMALDCDMSIRLNKSVITQYPVGEYDYLSLRRACFHGIELAKHEMEDYLQNLPSVAPQTIEQQPCEDAISRESAMLRVREFIGNPTYTEKMFVDDLNALSSVTPQPNKDCISRQGVINAINQNCIFENEYNLTASRIKNLVQQMPSVTPQPKTGHWIHKKNALGEDITVCSECGTQMRQGEIKYCGACGTKMEVEE